MNPGPCVTLVIRTDRFTRSVVDEVLGGELGGLALEVEHVAHVVEVAGSPVVLHELQVLGQEGIVGSCW